MGIDIFLNQIFKELTECLFWFIQAQQMVQKVKVPKSIIYQKVLAKSSMTSSSLERTFMTNPLIQI